MLLFSLGEASAINWWNHYFVEIRHYLDSRDAGVEGRDSFVDLFLKDLFLKNYHFIYTPVYINHTACLWKKEK